MRLVLNIYTDENLTDIEKTVEADRLKIPYKAAMYIIQSLDGLDLNDTKKIDDILNFVIGSVDKLDKIIKATFGLTDDELERVDAGELGAVATELYRWAVEKLKGLRGGNSKNVVATA